MDDVINGQKVIVREQDLLFMFIAKIEELITLIDYFYDFFEIEMENTDLHWGCIRDDLAILLNDLNTKETKYLRKNLRED